MLIEVSFPVFILFYVIQLHTPLMQIKLPAIFLNLNPANLSTE